MIAILVLALCVGVSRADALGDSGACCLADGTCENLGRIECETARGGQWQGGDTVCADGCPDCDCDGESDWKEFRECVRICNQGAPDLSICPLACEHNLVCDRSDTSGACDDGDPCTIDECTAAGCVHSPGPDKDADGCCDLVDRCPIDGKHGCGPGPDYIADDGQCVDVVFRAIVRSTPSGLDTVPNAASLPEEDAVHLQNGCFVIEVWVQETAFDFAWITCAFTDFYWEGAPNCRPKWTRIRWNETFDQFRSGAIDNNAGTGTNLGGCTLLQGVGTFPRWDRLATLHYDAGHPTCETEFRLTESAQGVSLGFYDALYVVQFGSALLEIECLGSLYDMAPGVEGRSPPRIGPEDFAFLSACWMAGGDGEELGDCRDVDFDCDGVVGPGDIGFFATGWMTGICDPGIVVPACRFHCDIDDARGMGGGFRRDGGELPWADAEMIRSFGLEVPPDDWGGWAMDPGRGGADYATKTRREDRSPAGRR